MLTDSGCSPGAASARERQVGVVGTDGGSTTTQTSAALGRAALPFLPTPMCLDTSWGTGLTGDTKRTIFCCTPSYKHSGLGRHTHRLILTVTGLLPRPAPIMYILCTPSQSDKQGGLGDRRVMGDPPQCKSALRGSLCGGQVNCHSPGMAQDGSAHHWRQYLRPPEPLSGTACLHQQEMRCPQTPHPGALPGGNRCLPCGLPELMS